HKQRIKIRWRSSLHVCIELKERIENKELDAGSRKDFFTGYSLEYFLDDLQSPFIPITNRVFAKPPFDIDQSIVGSPAIDAKAGDRAVQLSCPIACFRESTFDSLQDLRNIPAQMATFLNRRIMKPLLLFQKEFCFRNASKEYTATPGTKIHCNVKWFLPHQTIPAETRCFVGRSS